MRPLVTSICVAEMFLAAKKMSFSSEAVKLLEIVAAGAAGGSVDAATEAASGKKFCRCHRYEK